MCLVLAGSVPVRAYLPAGRQVRGIASHDATTNQLLAAIRTVESRGDDRAVGDGGRAIGPYQIHRACWLDGGGDAGRYRLDAWHADRCEPVILAYWRRHCPEALAAGDLQTLARVHNGGPKWYATSKRRAKTLTYWRRVQAELEAERRPTA